MSSSKFHLRVIYDVDGWAYHRQVAALQKYCPPEFEISSTPWPVNDPDAALGDRAADFVFLLDKTQTATIRAAIERKNWHTRLVVKWSNGWPYRIEMFHKIYRDADLLLINNKRYWEMAGYLPRTLYLPNGVDLDIFRIIRPISGRTNRVLWVGSELRRGLKGYDDYLLPLQAELARRGIDHDFRLVNSFSDKILSAEKMADWYNEGTILVCASSSEGTPNPALEAAACGCTIVSTPVGNMPELIRDGVNGYLVERNTVSILHSIMKATKKYPALSAHMQSEIKSWSWEKSAKQFFKVLSDLNDVGSAPKRSTTRLNGAGQNAPEDNPTVAGQRQMTDNAPEFDLTDKVTAFVATMGEPSFDACMSCVELQDANTNIEILENITPFSEAYREMLARCRTKYFIQVDADMLLYPHAFRTLYNLITDRPANTALFSAGLHDVHLERPIHGVKIFNHEIAAAFPPEDGPRWYVKRNTEFERNGFPCDRGRLTGKTGSDTPIILGLHGAYYDTQSIFNRYLRLERDRRVDPFRLQWFEKYPPIFFNRFMKDPTQLNLCALMGVMAGLSKDIADDGPDGIAAPETDLDVTALSKFLRNMVSRGSTQNTNAKG